MEQREVKFHVFPASLLHKRVFSFTPSGRFTSAESISSTIWIRVWLPSWGVAIAWKIYLFHLRSVFELKSALFWDVTQRVVLNPCRRFETIYRFHLRRSRNPRISWSSNMWPIGCTETSIRNYYYTLRNTPEERRSHLIRGRSLKSRTVFELPYKLIPMCETKIYTEYNDNRFSTDHYTNTLWEQWQWELTLL
jgi:hypothetical protein